MGWASWVFVVCSASALAGCSHADATGCSRDADCKGDRVCEHAHCVDDDSSSGVSSSEVARLKTRNAELEAEVESYRRGASDDHDARMRLELELKLCQAQAEDDTPGRVPSAKPPCKCDPRDPLCGC